MNLIDLYLKKTISYKHNHHNLQFKISQELFSSLNIDHGTQRLLRTLLFENIDSYKKVLDLGCGYGPIGVAMKKVCPSTEIHMVDVDALALEFAKENAHLNEIRDSHVYASLGYDQIVDQDFDVIVSNIPAKVGEKAITHILKDARHYLVRGGKVIVVVIDAIADFVGNQLKSDEDISITYHRNWPGHHVYHYQFVDDQKKLFKAKLAFEQGIFFKGSQEFQNAAENYTFDVSYNLPEFDQLDFQTKLITRVIRGVTSSVESGLCFNVGQGHVPLFVSRHFGLKTIKLTDRNLLSLKTSQYNLEKNQIESKIKHSVFPSGEMSFDLIAGTIPEKQTVSVYGTLIQSIHASLRPGAKVVIASTSTTVARVENILKSYFEILSSDKEKGNVALIMQK